MRSLFLILISSLNGFSQNLVPNPDFEQYTLCPDNFSSSNDELSRCISWSSFRETPDYYNICSSYPYITPPNCYFGFQYPHSGNAFVGFYTFNPVINNREFIGAQLISPLVFKQKYFISFYINLGGQNLGTIASDKIGITFSTVPYSYSDPAPINNTAHFYSNNIITDTLNWTIIRGSFVADSEAYAYLIIGNFFNDIYTDTVHLYPNNGDAYYYIDDICVSTDSLFCENWLGVQEQSEDNNLTIYPNPCTTQLTVQYNILPGEPATVSLLNITGKTLMQAKTEENEFTFNTENLPAGLYLVKVEANGTVALQKVIKE
jgi:hypothetical protein